MTYKHRIGLLCIHPQPHPYPIPSHHANQISNPTTEFLLSFSTLLILYSLTPFPPARKIQKKKKHYRFEFSGRYLYPYHSLYLNCFFFKKQWTQGSPPVLWGRSLRRFSNLTIRANMAENFHGLCLCDF